MKRHLLQIIQLLILTSILNSTKAIAQGPSYPQPDCMKTNILDINTGYNYKDNIPYWPEEHDRYWAITSAQGYATPSCAYTQWYFSPPSFSPIPVGANYRAISVVIGAMCNVNADPACNVGNNSYYTFRRGFWVDDIVPQNCILTINYEADDKIEGIRVNGGGYLPGSGTGCIAPVSGTYTIPIVVVPGYNEINIDILNRHLGGGGQSRMALRLYGSITYAGPNKIFIDNKHYIPNTSATMGAASCSPDNVYITKPEFTGNCISPPSTSTTVNITNYLPSSFSYVLYPNNITLTDSFFTGALNTTYTVTAWDGKGCILENKVTVGYKPATTFTVDNNCASIAGTYAHATNVAPNGTPPFVYANLNSQIGYNVDSFLVYPNNNYTIVTKDSIGCESINNITVGNKMNLHVGNGMFFSTPCLDSGGYISIIAKDLCSTANPVEYSFNQGATWVSGIPNNPLFYATDTVYTPGVFTIMSRDTFGCKDTATIQIYAAPNVYSYNVVKSKNCYAIGDTSVTITINVNGSGGPYLYQFNGSSPQASNIFHIYSSGTFTLTVMSADSCASHDTTSVFIADCSHCTFANTAPITTATWLLNDSASNYINQPLPPGPIIIDGTFLIDTNMSIFNRNDIYFTENARMVYKNDGGFNLTIANSTLQGCGYWQGIRSNYNDNSTMTILNSTIKQMRGDMAPNTVEVCGIDPGMNFTIKDNLFLDNYQSLWLRRIHKLNTPKIIQNNTFKGSYQWYNNNTYGILINCAPNITIGDSTNAMNGNRFEMLNTGICIKVYEQYYAIDGSIKIYNNSFKRMNNWQNYYYTPQTQEYEATKLASTEYGSAIYARSIGNPKLYVWNYTGDPNPHLIDSCDKGVIAGIDCDIRGLDIRNTLIGIHTFSIGSDVELYNNTITNCQYGIIDRFVTSTYNQNIVRTIDNNYITTRLVGVKRTVNPDSNMAPIGILFQNSSSMFPYNGPINGLGNNSLKTTNNQIYINSIAGIGIKAIDMGTYNYFGGNFVKFNSGDPSSNLSYNTQTLFGYWLQGSIGVTFEDNEAQGFGNESYMNTIRNSIGFFLCQNLDCEYTCNRVKFTRFGFFVWGNNKTGEDQVRYNKFSGNLLPWGFADIGSPYPGTFGTLGVTGDNGNDFVGAFNWLNPNGFKVVRYSNIQPMGLILTDPALLDQNESVSTTSGCEYITFPSNLGYSDPCPAPGFKGEEDTTSLFEIDTVIRRGWIDIVKDSVQYLCYPEVAKWIDEYKLMEYLIADSVLRNSDDTLSNFHNSNEFTQKRIIYNAKASIANLHRNPNILFSEALSVAKAANDLILGTTQWELNEKNVNSIILRLEEFGYDTISTADLEQLELLANSCPYVDGLAVFNARGILENFITGNIYDDRYLCSNLTSKNINENSSSIDNQFTDFLMGSETSNNELIHLDNIKVYPNPASERVIVEYNCNTNGSFILYNYLGQIILRSELNSENKTVSIPLVNVENGIYIFRCTFEGCENKYGKLIVSH